MRIVFLSGLDPTARWMLAHLRERGHEVALVRVVWTPAAGRARAATLAPSFGAALTGVVPKVGEVAARVRERAMLAHHDRFFRRLHRDVAAELGVDVDAPVEPAAAVTSDVLKQGAPGAAALAALRPDVMILNGAPRLGPEVLAVPRLGTINVHFGIAPDYRGSHTLFWALYERAWDKVGATLHHVSARLDGGAMLARVYPVLEPGAGEARVMARCARLAGEELDAILTLVAARGVLPGGAAQAGGGRLFRSKDRELWRDAGLAARRALGAEPPARAARVERFWASETAST